MLADLESTRKELEKEELSAPDGVAPSEVYSKLMACYLLENDLCSAKFLWKRAPASAKETDGPLGRLWSVGQKLWTKDFPATYSVLRGEWPDYLQKAVSELEGVIRERVLTLVSRAYTSITLTDLAAFAGVSADQVAAVARERGWSVDGAVVGPKPAPPVIHGATNCEKTLAVLTQYVSFLEN
ncbi:COP9 signalosome complex subunit 8 [Amphibalanus amphitrite]|uniref:COP9 signalosome complex subunit 8 n=2 Tax=Amphibalanus amphitrite TaxID=1232801 RepID=A0A6A4W373_AMPAM|nr:COP9 signalosome complex subunit 8-like isoform X2 [Amphibalanus amphitrite]XP_043210035.1 COP9 signalosome complex subunit 8-like isoform X2 [Amphibalanus amphitrite]XP_043210036.1 COP9 signalosome complex subunit 8-like isoform X2 [Amphibalanus amphitrite]XP_043210037.1 COP9 signalosome complex subunit 8-like isoform X2 [Amphibalanus amphitrite]KAF0301746.1 COP9 signalosome complex subunit 8 [Amphibalanus amphitrite]